MAYRTPSPAQSNTSMSDTEDDDCNKSTFFQPFDSVAVSPAQWSSKLHLLPHAVPHLPIPPACRLPPEILIQILKHLHTTMDLYNASLVSRAWCECSVELLWHRPSFSRLSTLVKMMRVLAREDQTFLYAQFIRRLNFLYLGPDLIDSLFSRLSQCTRLERLTLINCSSITDDGLAKVLPCLPNLLALDLTGVKDVTDRSIIALAASTKNLQGINLGGCKKLTDSAILALAENCPCLRRVKLSNVDQIRDEAVSALAKSCPLLLEIDLNHCKLITDASVRDLWTHLVHMREMRLSHCVELTDLAFPSPPRTEVVLPVGPNPFPTSTNALLQDKQLPPLRVPHSFDHLRMLDLTGCSAITDDAIEGIISVAPKIRNLVLAKCTQLTDAAVDSICNLGRYLHYLHLGHASSITDRSINNLARSCVRLRYVDLGNCVQLTDMSVFELASLQKLRRIGLVRVNNLTDQAIYALGERHATLERIHLSYCDQISVLAVHFLLQKLPKLSHLSLTGVSSFRRPELQQFCRPPPQEFNSSQRAAFCVYSGKGVADLRNFLTELLSTITDEVDTTDETDEEGDGYEEYRPHYMDDPDTADDDENDDEDEPEMYSAHPNIVVSRGGYRTNGVPSNIAEPPPVLQESNSRSSGSSTVTRELLMTRDRGHTPTSRTNHVTTWQIGPAVTANNHANPRRRGFGQQPIIETSTSPAPSDAASNRSTGTNQSNGTAFFRTYADANASARHGVMTPDLVYAEIGHGRGAGPGPSTVLLQGQSQARRAVDPMVVDNRFGYSTPYQSRPFSGSSHQHLTHVMLTGVQSSASTSRHSSYDGSMRNDQIQDRGPLPYVDASTSYHNIPPQSLPSNPLGFTPMQVGATAASISQTPVLQNSAQTSEPSSSAYDDHEVDSRGRSNSVKRSLRNTLTAAEQYASTFFFGGRGANGGSHDGSTGLANGDTHSH